jgi:hypothetical protein
LENNSKLLDDNFKGKSSRNISKAVTEALETVKKSSFFIKVLLLLFFGFHFIRTFIFVTTNTIANSRLLTVFDSFFLYAGGTQLISGGIIILYFIKQKNLLDFLILGSTFLFAGSIVLELYEFCPCMFEHSSSMTDHVHPHTTAYTLKQSFLCPAYSHRSRFLLVFLAIVGGITFGLSLSLKRHYLKRKELGS